MAKATTAPTETLIRPEWMTEFLSSFDAAQTNVYLFHNAVTDLIRPGISVTGYLSNALLKAKVPYEVIALYSVSSGITFPSVRDRSGAPIDPKQMRARFHQILGVTDESPDDPIMMKPEAAVRCLIDFLKRAPEQRAAAIMERVDNLVGDFVPIDGSTITTMELLHNAGTDKALAVSGNPLILMAPRLEEIREQVRRTSSGIKTIEVPLPSYEERLAFAKQRLSLHDMTELRFAKNITIEQLASLTASLSRRHIENILLRALKTPDKRLTREIALKAQREMMDLEFLGIIKRIDKPFTLKDVGGHVEAKRYNLRRVVNLMKAGLTERVPSSVLFVGPPGTGKTMLANAIANESGLNCLEVDLAQLMGSLVGETEKNVALLRRAIVANAPTMVFMDEIDQKVRRGEGGQDSGGGGAVENRLFSAILELTGDSTLKGKVVWYFASNRPLLLDKAFRSRMQAIIPLLPPHDDESRADVLTRIVNRLGGKTTLEEMLPHAGAIAEWSGRDLDQAVDEALADAEIDQVPFTEALAETLKYRQADRTDAAKEIKEALSVCKDVRLIPEHYRNLMSRPGSATAAPGQVPDEFANDGVKRLRKTVWGSPD